MRTWLGFGIAAVLLATVESRAEPVPQCTTTVTTTVTCTGTAAPLAIPESTTTETVPQPTQPYPPGAYYYPPAYAPPVPPPYPPGGYVVPPDYEAPPPKLRVELRPRYGLLAAGASVFGASYLLNAVIGGGVHGETYLAIPIVGPLLEAHKHDRQDNVETRMFTTLMVFDALVQTAGATMLIIGAATKKEVVVERNGVRVSFLPTVGAGGAGLAAVGRF